MTWFGNVAKMSMTKLIDTEWRAQSKKDDLAETAIDLSYTGNCDLIGLQDSERSVEVCECENGAFGVRLTDRDGNVHTFYLSRADALFIAARIVDYCYG